MKAILLATAAVALTISHSWGQGEFLFFNGSAPTHLYSIDGPLAGPGIWAQMLVGQTAMSLQPISVSLEHGRDGLVGGVFPITVPDAPCLSSVYVQMVAWDGGLWGTLLSGVPSDQLGRTDIVLVGLDCFPRPIGAPFFTQPAIVPIPEPSVITLGVLSASVFLLGRCFRRVRSAAQ